MNTFLPLIVKLLPLFWLLCSCNVVKCDIPDMSLVSKTCSARTYPSDEDPYVKDKGFVTSQLCTLTLIQGYNCYVQQGSCYGHAACNGKLSKDDCFTCLEGVQDYIYEQCGRSLGARVQLRDCEMRYEDYPFQED